MINERSALPTARRRYPLLSSPMPRHDEELVRDHLERIVRSPTFARSPQAGKFLRYVVEETLENRAEHLKAFTIGLQALGAQSERSDPDSIARMQARRVRKLLSNYYASVGQADTLRLALPSGTYQPRFESNAPAPEPSSDGLPGIVVEGYTPQGPYQAAIWLASGLDELTISALLSFGNLRVWKASKSLLQEPPAFVLSGSVWVIDGRARVFSALRDSRTGERIWHDRFDGSYREELLFELQDEICDAVCSRIADPIAGIITRTLNSGAPPSKLSLARRQFQEHSLAPFSPGLDGALAAVEQALTDDSSSPMLLASASLLGSALYATDPTQHGATLDEAEIRGRQAVALAPNRYDTRLAKALVHFHRREGEAAQSELTRSVEISPRALLGLVWGGLSAALMGNWTLGLERLHLATSRYIEAPRFAHLPHCLYHFARTGDIEQARHHARLFDTPYSAWGPILNALCLSAADRRYEAKRALQEAHSLSSSFAGDPRAFLSGYIYDPPTLEIVYSALESIGFRPLSNLPNASAPTSGRRRAIEAAPRRKVIPVGILHSLSGTMSSCERPLVDAALLAIEELNEAGGVLGRQVIPLVEDGASTDDIFATKARKLLELDAAATLFGCWTSSSRKAVRPVLERHNALLWYPLQYEGLERCGNIIYTGSCLNQQIEPATRWALSEGKRRIFLVGSDYVFPRTANHLIRALVETEGGRVVAEEYRPLGAGSFAAIVELVARRKPDIVLNTINGADNLEFFAELARAGLSADSCPVLSFSFSELDLPGAAGTACGHYACWSYFQNDHDPQSLALLKRFQNRYGAGEVLSDPTVTAYAQVHLWKQVVEATGSLRTDQLLNAVVGRELNLGGDTLQVRSNHHVQRRALIGQVRSDNQFDVIWSSDGPIAPKPWLGAEESNIETRALILEALGSLSDVVDHNATLEHEMARRRPPERGTPPREEGRMVMRDRQPTVRIAR